MLYERGVDGKGFAIIRSKGDQALFRLSTQQLKRKMSVPDNRPFLIFCPQLASKPIEKEHIDNNLTVREMLTKRGIIPENLPPAEDVKKLQRKLDADEKKILKDTKKEKK